MQAPQAPSKVCPKFLAVSDRLYFPNSVTAEGIEKIAGAGFTDFQLREKDLDETALEPIVSNLLPVTREFGIRFHLNLGDKGVFSSRLRLALHYKLEGIQLPEGSGSVLEIRAAGYAGVVGLSVHIDTPIDFLMSESPDYAIAAPVFPVEGKPNSRPFGLEGIAELSSKVPIPIVALGGIHISMIAPLTTVGASGLAFRSQAWTSGLIPI